jgi:hypothetical protein
LEASTYLSPVVIVLPKLLDEGMGTGDARAGGCGTVFSHVRLRANRTLNRHRRMTEF